MAKLVGHAIIDLSVMIPNLKANPQIPLFVTFTPKKKTCITW